MKFNEIKVGDVLYYFQSQPSKHRYFYITDKNKETVYYTEFNWTPTRKQKLTITLWGKDKLQWDSDLYLFNKFIEDYNGKYNIFKIIFKAHEIIKMNL